MISPDYKILITCIDLPEMHFCRCNAERPRQETVPYSIVEKAHQKDKLGNSLLLKACMSTTLIIEIGFKLLTKSTKNRGLHRHLTANDVRHVLRDIQLR